MKPLMLKIILFALTKVLQHSATKHVAVRDRMMQHNCAVQIRLKDNSIGRYYIFQNGRVRSELVSFYQSGFQIHSMLCQMALHHLLCSRLVTHPDKNSQALRVTCGLHVGRMMKEGGETSTLASSTLERAGFDGSGSGSGGARTAFS
jgi:hypothetical protein